MRIRLIIVALALAASACGDAGGPAVDPDGGFTQGHTGELLTLSYGFQPDTRLGYDFAMDVTADVTADIPDAGDFGDMRMAMGMAGGLSFDLAPGPDAGTTEVTMGMELRDFTVREFSMGGISMLDEIGDQDLGELFAAEALPEITLVMDAQGNLLEMRSGDTPLPTDLFGSSLGGGFSDPSGMSIQTMLFGPPLPEGEVRVGAEWTTDDSREVPFLGYVESHSRHRITGEDRVQGRDVLIIETVTDISDIELDFADMVDAMRDVDAGAMGITDTELAQMEAEIGAMDGLGFSMRLAYESLQSTTWFDPGAGLVVQTDGAGDMRMSMAFDMLGESGSMDMDMTMSIHMLLTDDGRAA